MRIRPSLIVLVLICAALPVLAAAPAGQDYDVQIIKVTPPFEKPDRPGVFFLKVQFKLTHTGDGKLATELLNPDDKIVVEEDGKPVAEMALDPPKADALTVVLAMDISGSMASNGKIEEAKTAADVFFKKLDPRADCGLILFDHNLHDPEKPVGDPARRREHREHLRRRVQKAKPLGGTAYLHATFEAVEMLADVPGERAVVVMTDGVDLNSKETLREVIKKASANNVKVYTVGVGEPGRGEQVTTVLVLDHSGSMSEPADDKDNVSKIKALHNAAGQFVDLMRPTARTTLLPFSTKVERPGPFSADKAALKDRIEKLQADGGTLLYDATYDAILTLEAARPEGKRAVVVLTDGVDEAPGSRHRVEEIIDEAKRAGVPLYMLGLGRPGELNEKMMQHLADATDGKYFHASNQQELVKLFEDLSIELHDDGIDEATLKELAEKTNGRYIPARDVSQLHVLFGDLADELQTTWTVTFPSRRSSHDGTARGIDISVVRNGMRVSNVGSAEYNVRGVVVPELSTRVYLGFLGVLGALLALPMGMRRLYRFYGGA